MSYTISVWSLVGANFERYIAICQPMQRMSRTNKKSYICCAAIWILAFLFCSPLLDAYDVRLEEDKLDCSHRFKWSRASFLAFYGLHTLFVFVLPLVYMALTFYRIVRALYTSEKSTRDKLNENFACETSRVRKQSEEAKLVKMRMRNRKITQVLLVVTLVFVLLWCPYLVMRLVKHSGLNLSSVAWKASQLVMLSTSAVNFFIYTVMSKEMRRAFWSVIRHCCCCCCCCCGCGRRSIGGSSSVSSSRSDSTRTVRVSRFGQDEFQCNEA